MSTITDQVYERMNDDLEICNKNQLSDKSYLQEFYAGKTIFMTGATGFMGKVFVEKILRSCPDVKNLYILVRESKKATIQEKINKYFDDSLFDKLKSTTSNFKEKIVTINGDLAKEKLGISDEDRQRIIDDVHIIVHSGATTRFTESPSVALKINVLATRDLLDIATECKQLICFTYVSTAYSHCYMQDIEEKFYESPADLKMAQDMIIADTEAKNGMTEEALEMLLGKWPNIYTFTKSMAEDLVRQYGEKCNFVCGVYRPSIVSVTYNDPISGWSGNLNGPGLAFVGTALGLFHSVYYTGKPFDLIPVDYSISALIAQIYDLSLQNIKEEKRAYMYNYGSSVENPTYINKLYDGLMITAPKLGSKYTVWYPFFFFIDNLYLFYFVHFFVHVIPAVLADIVLLLRMKKPRAISIAIFATRNMSKLNYFANGGWRIHMPQMKKVHDKLTPLDHEIFPFDIWKIDWSDFLVKYVTGARLHILKESPDTVPITRRRFTIVHWLHRITVTVLFLILFYYVYRLVNYFLSFF